MAKRQFVHYLGTHRNPHRDEILAFWLFFMFGSAKFDCSHDKLRWFFFDDNDDADEFYEEQRRNGRYGLLIGVGTKTELNEHRPEGRERNTCAALLMAQLLGVAERKTLKKLLEIAVEADTKGGQSFDGQANLIKLYHRYSGMGEADVVRRMFTDFEIMYRSAIEYHEICPEHARRALLQNWNGVRVGMVQSDAISMLAWMRANRYRQVTLVRRPNGHVAMAFGQNDADRENGLSRQLMRAVVPEIIRAECCSLGVGRADTDEAVAVAIRAIDEGNDIDVPFVGKRWYVFGSAYMLLNGSEAHPGRKPSTLDNLSFETAIQAGLASL